MKRLRASSDGQPGRAYTYRSIRDERRYGLYWYSGVWRVLRPVLVGITALIIVGGLLSSAWRKVSETFIDPPGDTQVVDFSVVSGQSLNRVAHNLENQGLVRSATVFKYYCDFAGLGQKLQPGDYRLSGDMTMAQIADRLTTGDGNPLVRNITLIPGWTVEDFAARLSDDGVIADRNAFLDKCRTGGAFSDYYYIADILAQKNRSQRKYILEGYLAADTYEIYTNASDEDILRKLLSQTERAFPADDQDRAEELGCTMDQILTLASLIEKEAKTADMAKVSAVFHNRLVKGMRLESDVTIHYITGVQRMDLQGDDLAVDSPYNTYRYAGLPPGPICSPSRDAIRAALYPDETFLAEGYLYFCAKDPASGELYFSKSLEEHEQAVAIYAPLWRKWDEERGL